MGEMKTERQVNGRPHGARSTAQAVRAATGILTLAMLLLATSGCGDDASRAAEQAVAAARQALAGDPSAALFQAKAALQDLRGRNLPPDPRLHLIAAEACLRLERRNDALQFAADGLALDELDTDLRADLAWAHGTALMGRFTELGAESDWRSANSTLQDATEAGHHQVEAATLLVFLQDLGGHSNPERQLKFARMVLALDPGGPNAARVQKLLDSKGLTP